MKFRTRTIYHQKKCMHPKLTSLLRMRTRCLTGLGDGGEDGGKKKRRGRGRVLVCRMGEEEAMGSSRFCWISSIFILADLCLLTISLQLENESTRANFTVRAHWTKPPRSVENGAKSTLSLWNTARNSGKGLVCMRERSRKYILMERHERPVFPLAWNVLGEVSYSKL